MYITSSFFISASPFESGLHWGQTRLVGWNLGRETVQCVHDDYAEFRHVGVDDTVDDVNDVGEIVSDDDANNARVHQSMVGILGKKLMMMIRRIINVDYDAPYDRCADDANDDDARICTLGPSIHRWYLGRKTDDDDKEDYKC